MNRARNLAIVVLALVVLAAQAAQAAPLAAIGPGRYDDVAAAIYAGYVGGWTHVREAAAYYNTTYSHNFNDSAAYLEFQIDGDQVCIKQAAPLGGGTATITIDGATAGTIANGGYGCFSVALGVHTVRMSGYNISLDYVDVFAPPTATPTATNTPLPPTATPTATATFTPLPPTATPTATATFTPLPPTATPTATNTPIPPTATPTATNTAVPPTATSTATATPTETVIPTPLVDNTVTYGDLMVAGSTMLLVMVVLLGLFSGFSIWFIEQGRKWWQ